MSNDDAKTIITEEVNRVSQASTELGFPVDSEAQELLKRYLIEGHDAGLIQSYDEFPRVTATLVAGSMHIIERNRTRRNQPLVITPNLIDTCWYHAYPVDAQTYYILIFAN